MPEETVANGAPAFDTTEPKTWMIALAGVALMVALATAILGIQWYFDRVKAQQIFIRESILQPQAKVVAGFEPVMPTFQGLLREREIQALVEFIKEQK